MEKDVEAYLRNKIKELGGVAFKFVSPGNDGVPDRLTILPVNNIVFIETKAPGKKSTPNQKRQQARLEAMGCKVYRDIDSKAKVDTIIKEITQ